jgi:hypothetical protein
MEELYKVVTLSASYEESYVGQARRAHPARSIKLPSTLKDSTTGRLNALVIARWVTFPWNAYLYTTFAVGEGISYATEVPELEQEAGASQWLNYLLFEVTFALPKYPEWAIVGRIHHRSGFFGALAPNGSNVVAAGIKYRF